MRGEIDPKQILAEKWPSPPDVGTKATWVFLHVDVIDHSRLFHEGMSNAELLTSHNLLAQLRDKVRFHIPDFDSIMEWDWAGDGGIYAFHTQDLRVRTTEKAVLVAELIRHGIRDMNASQADAKLRLGVRIVLTRGEAYYYHEPSLRCGSALNRAAKLRIPGEGSSITVTQAVWKELQASLQRDFRPVEPIEHIGEAVYTYAPASIDALNEAIADETLRSVSRPGDFDESKSDDDESTGDSLQASHLAYRLATLHFGAGERVAAVREFHRAKTLLLRVKDTHRYYIRTLAAFYDAWETLAKAVTDSHLEHGDGNDRRKFLRRLSNDPALRNALGPRWQFLHEMEFCIEQLDILARRPVADPSGLTSMQMCLLLERFGYPRRWPGSAISKRIARITEELKSRDASSRRRDDVGTMDHGCSLCTAVATSCLILDDASDDVEHMIAWLLSKKSQRFCFRSRHVESRVAENHHALHYAASVLQALLDYDHRHESIGDIIDVFFQEPFPTVSTGIPETLPPHWLRYLHIPYFELACYIFSALARVFIACPDLGKIQLSGDRREMLRSALAAFAKSLIQEARAGGIEEDPGRNYAARENLGSFALGLFVGFPRNATLIFTGVRELMAKVAAVDRLSDFEKRQTTVDSNFDRMWRMLDGWLLQWECALTLRERGGEIPRPLAGLFPVL